MKLTGKKVYKQESLQRRNLTKKKIRNNKEIYKQETLYHRPMVTDLSKAMEGAMAEQVV